MITLSFAHPNLRDLVSALRHDTLESAAVLLCVPVALTNGDWKLLVRDLRVADDADYVERSPVSVTLRSEFCLPLEKKAKIENLSLVYCHTHPHSGAPNFSGIDDRSETALAAYLQARRIAGPHVSLLCSKDALTARRLGTNQVAQVAEVGAELMTGPGSLHSDADVSSYDRQIRAFGAAGQQTLGSLKVGIVGLGGTGSHVAQQLAYLGVKSFLLMDFDAVEASNLNRLVGASSADIGAPKVSVAQRTVGTISPGAQVVISQSDVTMAGNGRSLTEMDFVFCCTDSHASRHLLNQLAYQYRVPTIDMGVAIARGASGAKFAGHVKMLAPGLSCLWCANHLDAAQVRRELMTSEQRAKDPYFENGPGVPQPAVISLNGTVASLAVTMFLSATVGVPSFARYLLYDGTRGRMNAAEATADPECPFCGPSSGAGAGDRFPLPERAT